MKFGGIWSFIVGAQVACTLLFVPAAVGIYTTSQRQNQSTWAPFPTERYLIPPQDGQRGAGWRAGCA